MGDASYELRVVTGEIRTAVAGAGAGMKEWCSG